MEKLHCTLLVTIYHLGLSDFSRENVAPPFTTGEIRLLSRSLSMRMETVFFILLASGVMWMLSDTYSLMKAAISIFRMKAGHPTAHCLLQAVIRLRQQVNDCQLLN